MVAPSNSGSVCHHVQQQTTTACVSRPTALGCGCPQSALVPFRPLYIPTSSHLGQSGGETTGQPLQQNNPDSHRLAKHALVLGPGEHVWFTPSMRLYTRI